MGHEPALIDAIAGKAAGQMIVDAAPSHLVERLDDHVEQRLSALPLPHPHQELQIHAVWKFRRGAEAAMASVESAAQRALGVFEELLGNVGCNVAGFWRAGGVSLPVIPARH